MLSLVLCFGRFLMVGQVVMEIIKIVPEADRVIQSALRAGFQSMKSTTLTLDIVDGKTIILLAATPLLNRRSQAPLFPLPGVYVS